MPYSTKGADVPPSRPGSDAWLGRRVRAWTPLRDALEDAETPREPERHPSARKDLRGLRKTLRRLGRQS